MSVPAKPRKFYAVRRGFVPGIYHTYAEAKKQVDGFHMNRFKSFNTLAEAEAFMSERSHSKSLSIKDQEARLEWFAKKKAEGKKKKKYNSSSSTSAAPYLPRKRQRAWTPLGSAESRRVGKAVETAPRFSYAHAAGASEYKEDVPILAPAKVPPPSFDADYFQPEPGSVYIDGACLSNGGHNPRAGAGVFFGPGDPSNIYKRLPGPDQTSCRAEIYAAILALEATAEPPMVNAGDCNWQELASRMARRDSIHAKRASLVIHTPSAHLIFAATQHIDSWLKRGELDLDDVDCMVSGEEPKNLNNPLKIYTDSKYLVDAATRFLDGWVTTGRTRSGRYPRNLDLLVRLKCAIGQRHIHWVHVCGHSGDPGNDAADKLAKAGAQQEAIELI